MFVGFPAYPRIDRREPIGVRASDESESPRRFAVVEFAIVM